MQRLYAACRNVLKSLRLSGVLSEPPQKTHGGELMVQVSPTQENRLVAALGYPIWIVALVVLLTNLKDNRFMRVHALQALGFTVAWVIIYIALSIITSIPFAGWVLIFLWPVVWVAWLFLALYYAYRTYQGEVFSIPIVSDFTSKYTTSI